jgi:hypothetical protein
MSALKNKTEEERRTIIGKSIATRKANIEKRKKEQSEIDNARKNAIIYAGNQERLERKYHRRHK